MALVRKWSRRIVVDGTAYRWQVRRSVTDSQGDGWTPLTFAVEDATVVSGAVLVVATDRVHPGGWAEGPAGPVLPAEVARGVRAGLAAGWRPREHGHPFRLALPA